MHYNPAEIEPKWQAFWEKNKVFAAKTDPSKKKFYGLIEFPYPSGTGLHVGHPRSYTAMDVICRQKRMDGYNVLYPIGFDAFGLPTENFAIKTGRAPAEVTEENIATFTRQLKSLGFSFDWDRVVDTTDPAYYKWTQWIFLQLFKHGLAYKKNMPINWCLNCKIGLANEEVVDGKCERCGGAVEKRDKEQWMLAITKYADKLLSGLDTVDYIPQAKAQQQNWIGRSEGAEVDFKIENLESKITVFTTRPDTLFGATYMVLAPEHQMINDLKSQITNWGEVETYINDTKKKTDLERSAEGREKTGVELKGVKAINPVNGEQIPLFIADYVLGGYGTGAIMAVPAHDERDFEFAKKFGIAIKQVVFQENFSGDVLVGEGISINSDFLDGLPTTEAKEKIIKHLEEKNIGKRKVQFKLRDWVFSRQRYWGEPIPLVFCENCRETNNPKSAGEKQNPGWIPLLENQLPLELPKVEKYQPTDNGESPLSTVSQWVEVVCPRCGGQARRETDTMPNWAGSSWYFLRYADPHNDSEFASKENLQYWMGVDWYNGGMEHTVLHLLYSRFWNQFLYDIGVVPVSEPYRRRTSHGMILAKGGEKMSKSKGNVVNPDDIVREYGADTLRLYILFMGPFDQAAEWDTNGIKGVRRFLDKLAALVDKVSDSVVASAEVEKNLHRLIKKITMDISSMQFNTAVAKMMEFVNFLQKESSVPRSVFLDFIKLTSPFLPHLAEELFEKCGGQSSVSMAEWPKFSEEKIKDELVKVAVQVNGKLRAELMVEPDMPEDKIVEIAIDQENVKKWLDNASPKKVIYVPGRILNLVI